MEFSTGTIVAQILTLFYLVAVIIVIVLFLYFLKRMVKQPGTKNELRKDVKHSDRDGGA